MGDQVDTRRLRAFASALEDHGDTIDGIQESAASVGANDDEETIDLLVQLLSERPLDEWLLEQVEAAALLMAYWSKGPLKDLVPALIALWQEPDHLGFGMIVLEEIGPDAIEAVPALIEMLARPFEKSLADRPLLNGVSSLTVELDRLAEFPDLEMVTRFREQRNLEYQVAGLNISAADVLAGIGPKAKAAIPALISTMDSRFPRLAGAAAKALGSIGTDAKHVIRQLILGMRVSGSTQCLDHEIFPWAAAVGLGRMGVVAVPSLSDELIDDSPLVRELAAKALGRIGPCAIPAAPMLFRLLEDPDNTVRSAALRALRKTGWKSDAIISVWSELLDTGDEFERHEAIQAIRLIGDDALSSLHALIAAVELQKDWVIRWQAIATLRNLGTAAREAVPVISKALSDPVHFVQCYAALALSKIAPEEPRILKNDIQPGGDSLLIFIEKQIDDEWVCASDKTRHRFFDEFEGLIPEYELRFVEIEGNSRWNFEGLIRRATDNNIEMKAAPRGLPMDISAEVLAMCESTNGGLYHSWLTLQELHDFDDSEDSLKVGFRKLSKRLDAVGRPDSVRIVFWLSE